MEYSDIFRLLCDVLTKMLIRVRTVSLNDPAERLVDEDLKLLTDHMFRPGTLVEQYLGRSEPGYLYSFTDCFGLNYIYMLLPEEHMDTLLLIGPYVTSQKNSQTMLEIEEKLEIPPKLHRLIMNYVSGIPFVPAPQHLLLTVEAFAEKLYNGAPITIMDKNHENDAPVSPLNSTGSGDNFDSTLIDMSIMERRYRFENEIMQAVASGQMSKADLLFDSVPDEPIERRHADPVRNFKNYCIITNTLLRKAAENGGVHPIYLDSISSEFAVKIERLAAVADGKALMKEMFKSYCRLVRKHSMKDYSPPVRKAVILIESDISADLSLSSIASAQGVSPGYLSTVFKRETGKTITEFIAEKRIKHAAHLLRTTHLQIQTVALHCGIMDVQYFSKIFKRMTGKTPKKFRNSEK